MIQYEIELRPGYGFSYEAWLEMEEEIYCKKCGLPDNIEERKAFVKSLEKGKTYYMTTLEEYFDLIDKIKEYDMYPMILQSGRLIVID